MNPRLLEWNFPLPRPYTGVLLGNGVLGLMVWGEDKLCLSIGRTGFWDRRGGIPFASRVDFSRLRTMLETGDEEGVHQAFASPPGSAKAYRMPTQLPGARLEIGLASPPTCALLDTRRGLLALECREGGTLSIRVHPDRELAAISGDVEVHSVHLRPAWEWIGATLAEGGVAPPQRIAVPEGDGFVQSLPADPGLAVVWRRSGRTLYVATSVGPSPGGDALALATSAEVEALNAAADAWWEDYTRSVPEVVLPDPALQRAWAYGLHKQAGLTPPQGVAATLQGPWMAETELPPWSNDYHFNINLQMIYWPALPTNRAQHLYPLWEMIRGWLPTLHANAADFLGRPGALMLPHAVDDLCQVVGHFWRGTIDQACTAWMAQIAWLHYRHTMDEAILRETAWPLLNGAFEGFWAMTDKVDGALSLPVSVSAEFPGWGRDASFQLAAFHLMARLLPRAAEILGEEPDPRWAQVTRELPEFCAMPLARVWGVEQPQPRIVLWHGQDLTESHRHHSHLAGISPFHTLDAEAAASRELVRRSMEHWSAMGPGQWVGWSMPWAAMIWARCNYASAAVTVLRIWDEVFTNEGDQTLHNADSPGYSSWIHGPFFDWPETRRNNDQMQMDAGFGVMQALVEIFVQQRGDALHVLPSLPKQWRDFSFDGVLCEGAFLAGATVKDHRLREVRITSRHGGPLHLVLPCPMVCQGRVDTRFTLFTNPGGQLVFSPPS